MRHNADELRMAKELSITNFNSLPIEMRKALASPYNRWLENELAIKQAEKHLADLKKRRVELEDWMIDWYREQKKLEAEMIDPGWHWYTGDYCIEPEPHYRPFKNAEEVMEAIKEHGGYVKEGNTYRYIKKFTVNEDGIITYSLSGWSSTSVRDWDAIHDKITFADGSPFGKLEE